MEGALLAAARQRALPQLRGRQARSQARHPVQQPRDDRTLPRGRQSVGSRTRRRPARPRALPDHRHRRAVGIQPPPHRRHRQLQGAVLAHRALAQDAGGPEGQARGGDRHRCDRRADHSGGGQGSRAAQRVPARPQLVRAAEQWPDHRRSAGRHPASLPGNLSGLRHLVRRLRPQLPVAPVRRGAQGRTPEAL